MSDEYIEITAKTVEEAVTEASHKFAVSSDRLDVQVVDQGSSGFMGFNSRPAVIRVKVIENSARADKVQGDVLKEVHAPLTSSATAEDKLNEEDSAGKAADQEEYKEENAEADAETAQERERSPRRKNIGRRSDYGSSYGKEQGGQKNYVAHSRSTDDFLHTDSDNRKGRYRRNYRGRYESSEAGEGAAENYQPHESRHSNEPKVNYTDEQIAQFTKKGEDFLHSMFAAMQMNVEIHSTFDKEENILTIDFEGDDMGVLIGKRGQTLDSIQYLVSLVVNRGIPGYVHVKADTEDYRERRRRTLENLARNMAAKVKRTRRACALEPMNPYERRIIHSALQGDRYVTTYSEGEDPYRHVVVTLKK